MSGLGCDRTHGRSGSAQIETNKFQSTLPEGSDRRHQQICGASLRRRVERPHHDTSQVVHLLKIPDFLFVSILQALAMSWSSISPMMVFLYGAGMGYGAHILSNTSMGNLKLWMLTVCNCALKPCAWRKCFHARLLKEPCSIIVMCCCGVLSTVLPMIQIPQLDSLVLLSLERFSTVVGCWNVPNVTIIYASMLKGLAVKARLCLDI